MSETLVINLFGAPGAGKSTGASYLFFKLKQSGINCEYITEFAKDKVWEENESVFKDQNYMFGKQSFKLSRVNGKVDVIITDSPLPLCGYYSQDECKEERIRLVIKTFNTYRNLNYYINRVKDYNPIGRLQNEKESDLIGQDLKIFLNQNGIYPKEIPGDIIGYDKILSDIIL